MKKLAPTDANEARQGRRRRRTLELSTLFCVLFTWLRPAWASFEFSAPRWDSASEFLKVARDQVGRKRVVLGAELDWSRLTEKDAVLLLHPTSPVDVTEASAFVSAGGRLAVVDDFGTADQLLGRFHIHRELAPQPPSEAHLGNPHLAIARPVEIPADGVTLKHPMVAQVEQVVTNHPTALGRDPNVELTPVLTLADQEGNEALFAVIGVIGDGDACGLADGQPKTPKARCGRLFAMADASVFIDLMMKFEGNRALAQGLVSYLLDDDSWGPRGGKLYVITNGFGQTGHYGDDDGLAHEVQRAFDHLHAVLDDTRRDGLPKEWTWLLALLATAGTGVFAWHSSGRLYRRPTPRYARPQPSSAQPGAAGRAAVLSAPTTHGALIMLELKSAAEEYLRQRLKLDGATSTAAILDAVDQQGALDRTWSKRLRELFKQLESAEKALVNAENLNFRKESIKQVHEQLKSLLPLVRPKP